MTATSQQTAPQVSPLRNLKQHMVDASETEYGRAAVKACNTVRENATVISAMESILAAGKLAKSQLPTEMEKSLDARLEQAYATVESEENLNETLAVADQFIGCTITEAKTKITEATEKITLTKATIDQNIVDATQHAKGQLECATEQAKVQLKQAKTKLGDATEHAKVHITEQAKAQTTNISNKIHEFIMALMQFSLVQQIIANATTMQKAAFGKQTEWTSTFTGYTQAFKGKVSEAGSYLNTKIGQYGPVVAPIFINHFAPVISAVTGKIASIFGYEKQLADFKEQMQKSSTWHKFVGFAEARDSGSNKPDVKLADAKVESTKEQEIALRKRRGFKNQD